MSLMSSQPFHLLLTSNGIQIYECFTKTEALRMAEQDGYMNATWLMAIHDAEDLDEAIIRFNLCKGVDTQDPT